jgi:peptidoglycan L-alanyl-D-glutamate endopeptidase CwlK
MQQAAKELGVPIVWGGVWDKRLADIGDPADAVAAYVARRQALGKKAFIDGPHFELAREVFP